MCVAELCVPSCDALTPTHCRCVVVLLPCVLCDCAIEGEGEAAASQASARFSNIQSSAAAKVDAAASKAKSAVKSALDD